MPKKVPMRMCVGCRQIKPKRELLRVVRSPEGESPLISPGRSQVAAPMSAGRKLPGPGGETARQLERALDKQIEEDVGAASQADCGYSRLVKPDE